MALLKSCLLANAKESCDPWGWLDGTAGEGTSAGSPAAAPAHKFLRLPEVSAIARFVHSQSSSSQKPFVHPFCASGVRCHKCACGSGFKSKNEHNIFFFTDVLNELAETTTLCCPLLELTVIVFMVGLSVKR